MLPNSFQLPVAIGLVVGGALACFAGYRLFRVVLAVYGFIAGAIIASSLMGGQNAAGMLVAAMFGGLVGAVVLFFAYFVGIALMGAGLGAFIANGVWMRTATSGDPPWLLVLLLAGFGTVVALLLQRYVIIICTSFSGAWTILVGALAAIGRGALPRGAADVWILYPFTTNPNAPWMQIAWIAVAVIGIGIQLLTTAKK